ncbi:thermonuclease family protein [Salinibacter altiplanensis]|uniref:thermonuclease family protein n=1 Tax=Salinibacter altiplanensis TaxID=1803181 RepID=UPI001E5B0DF2
MRLWGTDAPESSQPYGGNATSRARQLVGGSTVRVSVEEMDRYGRAVGREEVMKTMYGRPQTNRLEGWDRCFFVKLFSVNVADPFGSNARWYSHCWR